MHATAAVLLAPAVAATAPPVTGAPCDPANFERDTVYSHTAYGRLDLNTLPSPLNINDTQAGWEAFCCLYCVEDSRCQSWTLVGHTCSLHQASPGNRKEESGAVSGTPLPRIPDIPADSQSSLGCLSSYTKKGKYAVTHRIIGSSHHVDEECTPCWKPEPKGAKYLVVSPKASGSQKHPAYVWMPAEGQAPGKYLGVLNHIASHGYVVLSPYVDYHECRSNLCNGTATIYRNDSYKPSQKFACKQTEQGWQCAPSDTGDDGATCQSTCGPIVPKHKLPDTTCTVKQVVSGEDAVRHVLKYHETLHVDTKKHIGIGGASASAPQALKVVAHLKDDEAAKVGAIVMQHPSFQASHIASLDSAYATFERRAHSGSAVPAVLGTSGRLCEQLGPCAPILYNKACRVAAAAQPPDEGVLSTCGDCTEHAGQPVAWELVTRYSEKVKHRAGAASVSGPWHHWVPQGAGEIPIRRGCGADSHQGPETAVVIAWLEHALQGSKTALSELKGCDGRSASFGVDGWLLPRLDEDRLRLTPAGDLIEQAISAHGTPLQVSDCDISAGRVSTHLRTNYSGPKPPPSPPKPPPPPPKPPPSPPADVRYSCGVTGKCVKTKHTGHTTKDKCVAVCKKPGKDAHFACGGLGECFQNTTGHLDPKKCEAVCPKL